jgi:hypothetical protein
VEGHIEKWKGADAVESVCESMTVPENEIADAVRVGAESAGFGQWKAAEPSRVSLGDSAGFGRRPSQPSGTLTSGEAGVIAQLAARWPRGFTVGAIVDEIAAEHDLLGESPLQRAFAALGLWRPTLTGAQIGEWLRHRVDRPARGLVLRRGKVRDGYRRYRIEVLS